MTTQWHCDCGNGLSFEADPARIACDSCDSGQPASARLCPWASWLAEAAGRLYRLCPWPFAALGGSGGDDNVWPQSLPFFVALFREFERRIADHIIATGQPVNVKHAFNYGNGGTRPTDFNYYVFDKDGNILFQNNFRNP